MRSILKLVSANIRRGRGPFKGIAFLMMLIVLSFTGTVSNSDDLAAAIDEGFEYTDCGDIKLDIFTDMLTDDMREKTENNSRISRVAYEDTILVNQRPLINGEEKSVSIQLVADDGRTRVFNEDCTAHITGGTKLSNGEIYLPLKMRSLVSNGSEIVIKTSDGEEFSFHVKAFYEDPVYGAPTVANNYCIISREEHERILSKTDPITEDIQNLISLTEVNIHISAETSPEDVKKQINEDCGIIDACLYSPSKADLEHNIKMYSNVGSRIVFVYILLLTVIVMIIMNNSITSTVEMNYTDLGILKSQGFTQWQIRAAFIIQYTSALIIGAVIGLVLSFPVCGALIRLFKSLTGILTKTDISFGKCALFSLAIIIVCGIFVTAATAKIGRISPVRAISGGREDVWFESRFNVPVKKKPLSFFLALRQISSNVKNYAGSALIIAILIFFLISITVFVNGLDADSLFGSADEDITVTNLGGFELSDADEIERVLHETDEGAYLLTEVKRRMNVDGQQISVRAYGRAEDEYTPVKGRSPEYDNEALITENVSRSTGKGIGDTVTVKYLDTAKEFVVTGCFRTVSEYGVMVMITPNGMKQLGYENISSSGITLSDKAKTDEVISVMNDHFGSFLKAERTVENDTVKEYKKLINFILGIIAYVIYGMSFIFAAVVISMVTKAAFLRERTDIGIFKAVGLTSAALRMQFALRFVLVSLIGSWSGSIFAILLTKPMLSFTMRAVGLTDFTSDLSFSTFFAPIFTVCAGTYIFSYLSSVGVKKVEVRELITE